MNEQRRMCADLVFFRRELQRQRRLDDMLPQQLNLVDGSNERECEKLRQTLRLAFAGRIAKIKYCLDYYRSLASEPTQELQKDILLLENDVVVEEILQEHSWSLLYSKCRCLNKP